MPSKLTGMFASGRAVIAMASAGTELHDVVCRRGVLVAPGNPEALASAIDALAADTTRRMHLGRAGRDFAEAVLSREAVLREFEARLSALCRTPPGT